MTDFLYPFIEPVAGDATDLLVELCASAEAKAHASEDLRSHTLALEQRSIELLAAAMAERFVGGGRLFAFGNGGSATDAAALVALFAEPSTGRPLPALSLTADEAIVTALANDVGFELVFSRQLIAHARAGDIAVGLSTSGSSDNVLKAFAEARHRKLLTVGLSGFDGGRMAEPDVLDHCIVVRGDSVHRIQETQAAVIVAVWTSVQRAIADRPLGLNYSRNAPS